eukprot:8150230-Alexandrium_andersonii.AAC.1
MSSSRKGRPGNGTAGGAVSAASGPAGAPTRMSRAAETAPPMVWSAAWLNCRRAACCMTAIDSTATVGLSTMTEGSISGPESRMSWSASDWSASTIKGGGPIGSADGPGPSAGAPSPTRRPRGDVLASLAALAADRPSSRPRRP